MLAVLWGWRAWGTPPAPKKSIAPPAAVSTPEDAAAPPVEAAPKTLAQVGRDRPFLDAAGAGGAGDQKGGFPTPLPQFQGAGGEKPKEAEAPRKLLEGLFKRKKP